MAINTRQMVGLPSSPSFRYKQLNPAYQSDPRRILGQSLMTQGSSFAPVQTPLQGLGRLSSALVGAYLQKGAMDRQVTREDERTKQIMGMIPENASPEMRAYAQSNPEGFMSAFGQSLMQPKLTSELVDLDGGYKAIQNRQTGPFNNESSTISNLTQDKIPTQTSAYKNAISIGLVPGTPEFNDFIKKNSATGTTVNMNTSPGSKSLITRYDKITDNADTSNLTLNKITELEGLINNGVETGFGVESVANLGKIKQFFNPDYKVKEIAGIENFNATATQLVMPLVKQLGVNPTDNDLKMTEKGAATLGKTTAGNKLILKSLKVSNARNVVLSNEANKFIAANPNIENEGLQGRVKLENHLKKVIQTNPLWTEAGKLINEEYFNLTGSKMNESKSKSKIDLLIQQGDILQ
jgi:hypothetical protein